MQTQTIDPDKILELTDLARRTNAVWKHTDRSLKEKIKRQFAKVGVTRVSNSWVLTLENGRSEVIN